MEKHKNPSGIPLPRGWPQCVKSAMLHVISLAQFALAYTRGWAANSQVARVRLKAANDQLRQHVALLTEERPTNRHSDVKNAVFHVNLGGLPKCCVGVTVALHRRYGGPTDHMTPNRHRNRADIGTHTSTGPNVSAAKSPF